MILTTKEQRDANGRPLEGTAVASNRDEDDTDDDEDAVSPDCSRRETIVLSLSSGEELPHERPHT